MTAYHELFGLLKECSNLRTLRLAVHLEFLEHLECEHHLQHICREGGLMMKRCLYGDGWAPASEGSPLVRLFAEMRRLEDFDLQCVYESYGADTVEQWEDTIHWSATMELNEAFPHVGIRVEAVRQPYSSGTPPVPKVLSRFQKIVLLVALGIEH
jgi:hypothetical protein